MGTRRYVRLGAELGVIVLLGVVLGVSDVSTAVYGLVMAGVGVLLVGIELVAYKPRAPHGAGDEDALPLHEAGFVPDERAPAPPVVVELVVEEYTLAPLGADEELEAETIAPAIEEEAAVDEPEPVYAKP